MRTLGGATQVTRSTIDPAGLESATIVRTLEQVKLLPNRLGPPVKLNPLLRGRRFAVLITGDRAESCDGAD